MKKQVILICTIFMILSVAVLTTSIVSYPEEVKAYVVGKTNYQHETIRYLPNGYRVGIMGISQVTQGPLGIYSATNSAVQVVKQKETTSKLQSVKLIHTTTGGVLNAINLSAPIRLFVESQSTSCGDLGYATCNLSGAREIKGITWFPSVSLKAEITFSDGSYTIYADQKRTFGF